MLPLCRVTSSLAVPDLAGVRLAVELAEEMAREGTKGEYRATRAPAPPARLVLPPTRPPTPSPPTSPRPTPPLSAQPLTTPHTTSPPLPALLLWVSPTAL
jgi:hypothetical protein